MITSKCIRGTTKIQFFLFHNTLKVIIANCFILVVSVITWIIKAWLNVIQRTLILLCFRINKHLDQWYLPGLGSELLTRPLIINSIKLDLKTGVKQLKKSTQVCQSYPFRVHSHYAVSSFPLRCKQIHEENKKKKENKKRACKISVDYIYQQCWAGCPFLLLHKSKNNCCSRLWSLPFPDFLLTFLAMHSVYPFKRSVSYLINSNSCWPQSIQSRFRH